MGKRTIISAPGKVLVTGGYLVLDRQYSGLVIATSSRFYSCAKHSSTPNNGEARVSIKAGQFPEEESTWEYALWISTENCKTKLQLVQMNEDVTGSNKFVTIAVTKALEYAYYLILSGGASDDAAIKELVKNIRGDGSGLEVVVFADNDFYSQRESLSSLCLPARFLSLSHLAPFTRLRRPIPQTNKTGLGSSATLTTSLIASLLVQLGVITLTSDGAIDEHHLDRIHAISQLAHCEAQGKVGSGFDVSSAVYGSHLYTRFSPDILKSLMGIPPFSFNFLEAIKPSKWDNKVNSFRLPKYLQLLLADVDAGTDTPKFVVKVLKWREINKEEATDVWTRLDSANRTLKNGLRDLVAAENDDDYGDVMTKAVGWNFSKPPTYSSSSSTAALLYDVAQALSNIRVLMREMSEKSGVPIEPVMQTRLLDSCSALPGVLGGGVPGAGGYDALYLFVIDPPLLESPSPIDRVDEIWSSWKEMDVCPLSSRQCDEGLRNEDVDKVQPLKEALGW
ncbi:phosphomevalonate kinase [Cryptococcus depauperatus CBS 7841]|uniref:Phosphomevalonate kinase n=1 Tax=Cryptococcus depauperatus CBS 7841 TaxID=1295531 RepID=A0AAJ8LYS7_9TREE